MKANANESKTKLGARDWAFLAVVGGVLLFLALGSTERKARPTPSDEVHRKATSRAECLRCHGPGGVRPQPATHTKLDQCFMCHLQPKGWVGAK